MCIATDKETKKERKTLWEKTVGREEENLLF